MNVRERVCINQRQRLSSASESLSCLDLLFVPRLVIKRDRTQHADESEANFRPISFMELLNLMFVIL